jgi:predicted neuraminidase
MFKKILFIFFICISTLVRAQIVRSSQFVYDTASFASCHASTIVETPKGIMTAWFGGKFEGDKDVNIYASWFVDNAWSIPIQIADGFINDSTRYACYNPVLFLTSKNELLLFYKIGPNVQGWTGWMKRSTNYGVTWSAPERLPDGILGPIRNQPYEINGMLVCPSSTEKNGWKVHFEYTSDAGKTWTKGPDLNDANPITGIQPAVLNHKFGVFQALTRSQNGTANETWSYDNGKTWTPLTQTGLINNNSGIDAITLQDGRHLLVYNNCKAPSRSPLNVAISKDGKKWEPILELENEVGVEFSYPYVIQTADQKIHITYTWKRKKIKHVVLAIR